MNQKEAGKLLDKYLLGQANQQDETIVQSWLIKQTSDQSRQTVPEYPLPPEMWNIVQRSIRSKRISLRLQIAKAAAISAIIFGVGLFYYRNDQTSNIKTGISSEDVAPGKQGATLTLANGKKVRLSDVASGEIAKEAGIVVTKTEDGQLVYELKGSAGDRDQINSLTTDNGETYVLTLPDKSKVWMNAASSLTYSANLVKDGVRTVKLQGEAYFEISKDKKHPFIVEAGGQTVEVLGTHFNINSYTNEAAVATTLLEGSVKVTSNGKQAIIRPGEQALTNSKDIKIKTVDVASVVDWKDGDFILQNMNFKPAMREIARWYNVEVVYDQSVPDELQSGGWISRDTKLSEVLAMIEKSGLVQFRVEGRKIFVSKKAKEK